jgi:yeast amino acid transporter
VGLPAKLVAVASAMTFWVPSTQVNPSVWISSFGAVLIVFNLFNVRRYGEIEFWLATTKVTAIVGIIFMGLLLPMDASTSIRKLGTDPLTRDLLPCNNTLSEICVSRPGFGCNSL